MTGGAADAGILISLGRTWMVEHHAGDPWGTVSMFAGGSTCCLQSDGRLLWPAMNAGRRVRGLGTWVVAATFFVTAPVMAQDDVARAATLSRDAEKLLSQGKTAEACDKLTESLKLDRRGATALDLAVCREKQGRLGQAYRAYGVAAELAQKEKRQDREKTAKSSRTQLYFKLPKITVKPPASPPSGFKITINGEELPPSSYNKSWETDPGKVVIVASAPGHSPWETTLEFRERETKTQVVPALVPGAAPVPVTPTPTPTGKPGPASAPPPPAPEPEEPEEPSEPLEDDEGGRLVVEIGPMGGLLIHTIGRSGVEELNGTDYQYRSSANGETIATCGDTTSIPGAGECDALFDTEIGGLVGGELFVGWAIIPRFHLGVRGFGAKRFNEGWLFAGGPSFSVRAVGPVWLGASFLVGASEHDAFLTGAEGSVPPEHQALNDGQTMVNIPLDTVAASEAIVPSGILVGGGLELSFAILGPSPNAAVTTDLPIDLLAGSLMLGLWPSLLVAEEGFVISVPAGFAYRFH